MSKILGLLFLMLQPLREKTKEWSCKPVKSGKHKKNNDNGVVVIIAS